MGKEALEYQGNAEYWVYLNDPIYRLRKFEALQTEADFEQIS